MMRTLILTDKEGWHYNELKKSLIKLGHSVFSACLTNISIKLDAIKVKLFINNEPIPEVDNVIVRFVPGGTLEEIVYFLNILKILESKGVNVINNASSIEKTVDKLHTSYLLNKNNIKTPLTYVLRGHNEAYEFIKNYHKELIYKPLFGSQGDGIKIIRELEDLTSFSNPSNVYYFQEYLANPIMHDYRVLVIRYDNTVKYFYMTRYGQTFINNFSKGAKCIKENFDNKVIDLALETSEFLQMKFCGVDIMKFKENYYVIEVNSIPAWKGLQEVEDQVISDSIVGLFK